jgi:predicted outer membrane repeat protein
MQHVGLCSNSTAACGFYPVAARRDLMSLLLALLSVLLWQTPALAACDGFHPVPEFYVGDDIPASPTYDSLCTHNDIQSAIDAATCSYGTKIFVTREHTYTNQHLTIANKNITLIARGDADTCGPASIVICNPVCAPPPTGPLGIISGSNDSIFAITGTSNVTLRYLDITGATHAGNGGGIDFEGSGSLTLDTSWVGHNTADNGGGIYFNGAPGTPALLTVLAHTEIFANTANGSGGGILVAGNSLLTMVEPDTQIDLNSAPNGYGGGIAVIGPANANIGSPDSDNGTSVVNQNSAAYGGGIAIKASTSDYESAAVRLFTTDPSKPVGITNNTATHTGGGIYLKPFADGTLPGAGNGAYINAWDYRIEHNIAVEGAAIYADVDSSITQNFAGEVYLGDTLVAGGGFPTSLGAVVCTNATACNSINGNETTDPTQGSIVLIQDTGYLIANRFSMRHNTADHVIRIVGDGVITELFNCLAAENTTQHELIYASGNNGPSYINSCTFANDAIGSAHVIHSDSNLSITDSIIDEAGTLALDYSGDPAGLVVNYVLSNDITTLPGTGIGVIHGVPTFVDLSGGDYHLQTTSLGIDFAPTTNATYVGNGADLEGKKRNVDLPSVSNVFGTQDLGAYELQNRFVECGATDSIFCDGFGP